MYVFLPAKGQKVDDLVNSLNGTGLNNMLSSMSSQLGNVMLPKFNINCTYEKLLNTLHSLGIDLAFSDYADFSLISKKVPLKISKVIHKTFINVNESGTEAAAATAVQMDATTSLDPTSKPKPFNMIMDRPFLYMIKDNNSGNILFIGTVKSIE